MNHFTFYSPTLFAFGDGQEEHTGELVRRFGGTRVLLVYGGGSVKRNGAFDAVTQSLQDAGISYVELSGIQANPRSGKVYEGIELARKENADFWLPWAAAVSLIRPKPRMAFPTTVFLGLCWESTKSSGPCLWALC